MKFRKIAVGAVLVLLFAAAAEAADVLECLPTATAGTESFYIQLLNLGKNETVTVRVFGSEGLQIGSDVHVFVRKGEAPIVVEVPSDFDLASCEVVVSDLDRFIGVSGTFIIESQSGRKVRNLDLALVPQRKPNP